MLLTNLLVVIAIIKDNVWLLLPWMVLHCVVIAFLALGAVILSVHGRGVVGSISLLGTYKGNCISIYDGTHDDRTVHPRHEENVDKFNLNLLLPFANNYLPIVASRDAGNFISFPLFK